MILLCNLNEKFLTSVCNINVIFLSLFSNSSYLLLFSSWYSIVFHCLDCLPIGGSCTFSSNHFAKNNRPHFALQVTTIYYGNGG